MAETKELHLSMASSIDHTAIKPYLGRHSDGTFPTEIWEMILDFLAPHSNGLVKIESRYSLSVESFASEPPPAAFSDSSGHKNPMDDWV